VMYMMIVILCWYLFGVSSSSSHPGSKPCFNCFFWSGQSSMGFLKRIFSFGSKKKRSPTPQTSAPSIDNERRRKLEEEHEVAVGRILRSSSSRYAIVKETDYSNLPPLRKPLCHVIGSHTESSSQLIRSMMSSRAAILHRKRVPPHYAYLHLLSVLQVAV